jgi:cysteine-rich repeat protein
MVSVRSEAVHVFAPDYTTSKEKTQFVIHDGATFTGFSGAPHEASPWYGWNEIIVLSGGAINCTGYAITQDFNGPARDGERRLGLHGSIWVATGGILDLESCVSEGHQLGSSLWWAKWSSLRYEAGATVKLGNLEGSTALRHGTETQSRIQCALDAGMEINGYNVCGDSMRTGVELGGGFCDDGNMINGDGCSSSCTVEEWFSNAAPFNFRDDRFRSCKNALTWTQIRAESGRFFTGGLGKWLVEDRMEVWVCDKSPNCPSDIWSSSFAGQMLCSVYMEKGELFVPLGLNSNLKFVKKSVRQERALIQGQRKLPEHKKVRAHLRSEPRVLDTQAQVIEMIFFAMQTRESMSLHDEVMRLYQEGNLLDEGFYDLAQMLEVVATGRASQDRRNVN